MLVRKENHIRKAVDTIGGVTKASNLLGVSNNAVYGWISKRKVSNIDLAKKLAELSGMPIEKVRPV